MLFGISIPWYEMSCSYTTAINIIPRNMWFIQINDSLSLKKRWKCVSSYKELETPYQLDKRRARTLYECNCKTENS